MINYMQHAEVYGGDPAARHSDLRELMRDIEHARGMIVSEAG